MQSVQTMIELDLKHVHDQLAQASTDARSHLETLRRLKERQADIEEAMGLIESGGQRFRREPDAWIKRFVGSATSVRHLTAHIAARTPDNKLVDVLAELGRATLDCERVFRQTTAAAIEGAKNPSGDEQLDFDIWADQRLTESLFETGRVAWVASEESKRVKHNAGPVNGAFTAVLDGLDGSGNVLCGWDVGIIFGISDSIGGRVVGQPGSKFIAAGCVHFGLRTHFIYSIRGAGTHIFRLNSDAEYELVTEDVRLGPDSRFCYVGGGRDNYTHSQMDYLENERLKSRWTGCLAAEVTHMLFSSGGLFAYREPKLRTLYEILPIGLMIEEAGGLSLSTDDSHRLTSTGEVMAHDLHERRPFYFGSRKSVQDFAHVAD